MAAAYDRIRLVRNDTRPALVCTLEDENTQVALDLTGCTVNLHFRVAEEDLVQATVVGVLLDPANGQVVFYPATAPEMLQGEEGPYEGEIEIIFPDGQVQTMVDTLRFSVRNDFA